MATGTARGAANAASNYWPGFVDALSTLVLGIIFLLTVFVVVQFYLSQEVAGKDTALTRLNAQIAQLTDLLSLEKTGKVELEDELAQLRANLSATPRTSATATRASLEGAGGSAGRGPGQGDRALRRARSARRTFPPARWRRSRFSTSRSRRCAASSAALEDALDASEQKDKECAGPDRRSRPAAQRGAGPAGAGALELSLRLLRPVARNPRQPARHPHRRRPLRVPIRGVLRHRPGRAQARRDAPSSTSSPARCSIWTRKSPRDIAWVLRVDGHTDMRPINSAQFKSNWATVGGARRSRWCNT